MSIDVASSNVIADAHWTGRRIDPSLAVRERACSQSCHIRGTTVTTLRGSSRWRSLDAAGCALPRSSGIVDVDDMRRANWCIECSYEMHTMPQYSALIDRSLVGNLAVVK